MFALLKYFRSAGVLLSRARLATSVRTENAMTDGPIRTGEGGPSDLLSIGDV